MPDFTNLLTFSHTHCVAICAFLVPLNLIATLQTIVLTVLQYPSRWRWQSMGLASLCAVVMVLHVVTWFVIGVVAVQTFVLFSLGGVCLAVNLWAVLHPESLRGLVVKVGRSLKPRSASSLST
jgi:hypothetical protein